MGPVAEAVDFLQFFGYFVPAMVSFGIMRLGNFKFLAKVSAKIFLVAAISVPEIKLTFLKDLLETATTQSKDDVKKMFNNYVIKCGKVPDTETRVLPEKQKSLFLDFKEESVGKMLVYTVQCVSNDSGNYLQETILNLTERDTTTNCFKTHTPIKNVFLKYNNPLPSSAPVERLFSLAGIVNILRRQKLTDANFEMLVTVQTKNLCI
ncbi:hypothetical protein FF38_00738 [Lucilia cuprina]|uniref:HAT C-terminal dimerisation domain-containing protein n=1 Tax=Lucilia cuprina TaxID=7375 RepID=A0A0L0CQ96_LUCCU|nr:hypothetical protein FF38_00738 [Lucilia cuprina]